MSSIPLVVTDSNLSYAWGKAFLAVMQPGIEGIIPLLVTVTSPDGDQPAEDLQIRQTLDQRINELKGFNSKTVAGTIFPKSMWNRDKNRHALFDRYKVIYPTLKKADRRNRYGLYFQRLIAYGDNAFNQLEHIINGYQRGNRRPTLLQAGIFDVTKDHTFQPRRGFPCLQQVSFTLRENNELAITGYYTSQFLFERAYGNYLGLWDLGHFVAHELGRTLTQMNCVAALARCGGAPKSQLRGLTATIKARLEAANVDLSGIILPPKHL